MSFRKPWLALLTFIFFFIGPLNAEAVLFLDDVFGTWSNITRDDPETFEGVGTNEVRWGTPAGGEKSGLGFVGSAPPSSQIIFDDPFSLGTLTHFNFPTLGNPFSSSENFSADLSLSLNLRDGNSTAVVPRTLSFGIEETKNTFFLGIFPNLGGCPPFQQSSTPCDDRVFFPSRSSETFTLNEQEYAFETLGFQLNNQAVSEVVTQENGESSVSLLAKITQTGPAPGDITPPPTDDGNNGTPPPPPDDGEEPPPPPPDDEEPPPPVHPPDAVELQEGTPFSSENDAPPLFSSITGTGLWTLWDDGTGAQFRQGRNGFNTTKPTVVFVHGWQPDNRHLEDWTAEDPLLPSWIRETVNKVGIDTNGDGNISGAERVANCTVGQNCPENINMELPDHLNGHEIKKPDTAMPQFLGNRDDINILAWNWVETASTSYNGILPLTGPRLRDENIVLGEGLGPLWPGFKVNDQGLYLAEALKRTFGRDYDQSIHLIGHSLGGGVVTYGALQLEKFDYDVDQVTLFDVPEGQGGSNDDFSGALELKQKGWLNEAIRRGIWIDNYPTAFGTPYSSALGSGDIVNLRTRTGDFTHGYPINWYLGADDTYSFFALNGEIWGNEGTLAANGLPSQELGAYWSKVLNSNLTGAEIDLIRQELGKNNTYFSPDPVGHPYTLVSSNVKEEKSVTNPSKIDIGDADLWAKKGDVYFLDGYHMTTASPVFLFREFDFPQDSQYLSFDFFLENPTPEDQLVFLIGHDYFFRYEGAYFPENWNSFLNSGPIDVSGFASTNQWLTFLYNSEEAGHRAQIANINLYRFEENVASPTVPEPSTILLLSMGMAGALFSSWNRRKQSLS